MAPLKQKGDLAELKVATDLVEQGYRILLPFGEDHSYDLVIDDGGRFQRVQVKHTRSDGRVLTASRRPRLSQPPSGAATEQPAAAHPMGGALPLFG